ncbi:MAG: translation repressor protein [Hyphomicrobiales bacterium]|nr:MAG: translation repressor protein [Hyphomicrobiales bacterium]PCJ96873.1 MAG: translation repressor protein [Hyphomicrobiales bacterium]
MNDLFKDMGITINLKDKDDFNIVRETLTRIGIASFKNKTLTQSCHIFHKQGNYAIMHFKEMLAFDGKTVDISDQDILRRNTIVSLLQEWDLLESMEDLTKIDMSLIKVLSSKEKNEWQLVSKYTIGK